MIKEKRFPIWGQQDKEVVGVASDFYVVVSMGSWIQTYDQNSRKIAEMGVSGKTVHSAAGSTFTVKSGGFIQTYDKNCKKISERNG